MTRNYRGRYEGDDGNIGMVSERRRSMMEYNKFWVAIAGFAIQALTSFTGFDPSVFGLTPEAIIGFVTAVLVYFVPNKQSA